MHWWRQLLNFQLVLPSIRFGSRKLLMPTGTTMFYVIIGGWSWRYSYNQQSWIILQSLLSLRASILWQLSMAVCLWTSNERKFKTLCYRNVCLTQRMCWTHLICISVLFSQDDNWSSFRTTTSHPCKQHSLVLAMILSPSFPSNWTVHMLWFCKGHFLSIQNTYQIRLS